jgi:hypothetical protein
VAQARADFAKWHALDLERKCCMVFRFPDRDKELVLVPVRIKTGAAAASLLTLGFFCFVLGKGVSCLTKHQDAS